MAISLASRGPRPALGLRHLAGYAMEIGIDTELLLSETGVAGIDFADPTTVVDLEAEAKAVRRVLATGADPATTGVMVGSRYSLTHLGLFGFAAMSCATVRELITISARFFALSTLRIELELSENPVSTRIELCTEHLPEDVRDYFATRDAAAIAATVPGFILSAFTDYPGSLEIHLGEHDAPLMPFLEGLPISTIVTSAPVRAIIVPTAVLDVELPQADEETLRTCIRQCERLLERMADRDGTSGKVRACILAQPSLDANIDGVAESLLLHPRTLRRRLAAEGTSFRSLLDEVRRTMAAELLCEVGLTVEETARRLGYSEPAAFTHAFTRWYGLPPRDFRRQATSARDSSPETR